MGLLSSATGITGSTSHHQQHGQRWELHHGGRRVHGHADGLRRSNRSELGATLTITGAASAGPLDCESLDCPFTATSGGVSTGSVVCGDVTSSGTVSAPQLFASNTLIVTNTSDFSDDLFLTKNWAGWSKLQVSNNSAAPDSGPELRLLGNQSARVFLERDGGAHQRELIMINDEALVQTKSLLTQLSLTTNQRNPGCLVIAGNTGNVVCNTSFTDLSDSRVKTEIAEADVADIVSRKLHPVVVLAVTEEGVQHLHLGVLPGILASPDVVHLAEPRRRGDGPAGLPANVLVALAGTPLCGACVPALLPGLAAVA